MAGLAKLSSTVWVAGQIDADSVANAAALGVTRVINNRPDGEDDGQPTSDQIEMAIRASGLDYLHLPIVGFPGPAQVKVVAEALADGKPTLLYCRSGMRSAAAWALAMSSSGNLTREQIREAGAMAGYDLNRLPL